MSKSELQEDELQAVRYVFEEKVFERHFISSIERTPGAHFELQPSADLMDKVTLCRLGDDGRYIQDGVEPAWWGFRKAAEMSTDLVAVCLQKYNNRIRPVPPRKKKTLASHFNRKSV